MFGNVSLENLKTTTPQKQPIWDKHKALASYANKDFGFRTLSSDYRVMDNDNKFVFYKISCFYATAGFVEKYSSDNYTANVGAGLIYAKMLQVVINALNETGLSEHFALDSSTFKQEKGKNATRNFQIYIVPKFKNGIRSYIDTKADLFEPTVRQTAQQTQSNNNGWEAIAQPQTPATTSAPSISGWGS